MPETTRTRRERVRRTALDEGFYAELLHIAGLCETVSNGKPAIARRPAHERAAGSLIENALARIEARDGEAGSDAVRQERFDAALRLCIAWISRLVFLKVLEARLLALQDGNPAYAFLRADRIGSFGELDALCDEVFGDEVDPQPAARFPLIPRFDGVRVMSDQIERAGVALADDPPVPLVARTILKNASDALGPVAYLLTFLDAFDFSAHAPCPIHTGKPRIDAAALGLIFERFNGYRDGAWFTPGRVAMHLCRAAIESAAIRRFNQLKGWRCETVDQLCEAIEEREEAHEEARAIVDSLRVCDPAVGSGHLLVSSLNERVALKSRLRLITGLDGEPLDDYRFEVEADRLVVKRFDGEPLHPDEAREKSRRIDEILFREKRAIVEHGLFGVDLNPVAAGLTRLRLWIELLEHAGYDGHGRFARLPNLDVNIREGNATISRIGLDAPMRGTPREIGEAVGRLREAVSRYRTAANCTQLADAADRIAQARGAVAARLRPDASERTDTAASVYENAFEWRIEFPDILDDDGTFRGFDAVVANPPYIDSERMVKAGQQDLREHLARRWPSAKGNWDLYVVFMELGLALLAPAGAMAYLTPDKWLSKPFGDAFRARHLDKIERIVALGHDVFDEARVDSILTIYANDGTRVISTERLEGDAFTPLASARKAELLAPWRLDTLLSPHYAFVRRLEHSHPSLGTLLRCENACATSDAYRLGPLVEEARAQFSAQHHFRVVNTGTLGRFVSRWGIKPMTYLGARYLEPMVERARFAAEFANAYRTKADAKKVMVKGLTRLDATLDLAGDTIPGKTTLILRSADENLLKFAAAVLNCPLAAFYVRARYPSSSYNGGIAYTKAMIDSVPVPGDASVRSAVVGLVDQLLSLSRSGRGADAEAVAREIDRTLYAAFGLSADEIARVAGTPPGGARNPRPQNEKMVTDETR